MEEEKPKEEKEPEKPPVKQVLTSKNEPERDEKGRLLPGNTANPKGRPKFSLVSILREELEKYIKTEGDEKKITYGRALIQKFIKKAIVDEDLKAMIDAIDRMDGKAKQNIGLGADEIIDEIEITLKQKNETKTGRGGGQKHNGSIRKEPKGIPDKKEQDNNQRGGNGVK